MYCSQPAAWTTNRSLLVASCVRPFQENRPIPAQPYPELRTWMVVRSGVISVFPTNSGNAPASPDIRPTTWLCNACLPSTNSMLLLLSTPLYQPAASRVQHPKSCGRQQSLPPGGKERLHFVGIRPEVQARKGGW